MANVSYRLEDLKKAIVGIGYVGENDHMHVMIDCKEVFDEYPDAVATMAIVPPVGESYPKVVNRNGDVVEWLVKNSDVAAEGDGEFQITFTEGEVIKKSVNGRFRVIRSISGSGNAPSGIDDWMTDANEKLAAVEEATQEAEDAAEHQPRINASGYWEIWDTETGAYVATSTKAQGDKGDPGDPGTPGDPTELIDDTAGSGTTGKTWSADKINDVTSQLSTDITKQKEDLESILVQKTTGESVTLTNIENVYDFVGTATPGGFTRSYDQETKTARYDTDGSTAETNPYARHNIASGTKKWVFGFKYKLTKASTSTPDPQNVRMYLGQTSYDSSVVLNEWISFEKTVELNLTRLYFILRDFATAPAENAYHVEMKDMYLYDATGVTTELCALIHESQRTNYKDGTVTYGETSEGYFTDTSLVEEGKAADSKAVGDAFNRVCINVKNYGVKGDGTTDDTDAINAIMTERSGDFYFPAGTYKISGTIILPADSSIYGDGDTTIIDMYSCDDLEECTFRGNDKIYPYILINDDNCHVSKIKLTGNDTLQEKRHGGICVIGADKCSIKDVTIYNINFDSEQTGDAHVSGYGICVTRSKFAIVERCNVVQCGYECIGIVDSCRYCVVRDCYTQDGWRTCIQVHRGSCDTVIENCYMKQTHDKYDACFTVHGLTNNKVVNLTVNNCVMECLQNGDQGQSYCAPAQIMGDTVNLCFTYNKIFGGKRAFYISEAHTNAKIIGNDMICNDTSDYGVTIKSYETVVVGNVLENEASAPVNTIANNPVLSANIGIS